MGRGDLDKTGTEVGVDVPILKDGNLAVDDGELDGLTHEGGLLGILRGDGDARVAEHGLGARGGDDDVVLAVDRLGQRVAQVHRWPFSSLYSASSSEIAVVQLGHQLTMRLPR